jgi:phytanoyl-CoA hydroxylase
MTTTESREFGEFKIDLGCEEHDPELYAHESLAHEIGSFAEFSQADLDFYLEHGYLAVKRAFSVEEVRSALDGLNHLIEGGNPEFKGLQFEARIDQPEVKSTARERLDQIRKVLWFVDYDERLKALSEHSGLKDVVERIIGGKCELFQDMALLKPPKVGREKPWHQDHAYFNYPLGTRCVGVWIALDEAGIENGCMRLRPGSHLEGPVIHFQRRDWQICDRDVKRERVVAAPLPPGGCLLFDSMLHHGTPANRSNARRRALQFHYKPAGLKESPVQDRLEVFGSEGKDVSC